MLGKKEYGYRVLSIDTKKKQFAVIHTGDRKVLDDNIDIQLNDVISIYKNKASEKMIELFKKVKEYSEKTSIPISKLIDKAIAMYLETVE